MREVPVQRLAEAVRDLCIEANTCVGADHVAALKRGLAQERSPLGREVLEQLIANGELACRRGIPFCQDTGYAVLFVRVGQEVHFSGGDAAAAIDEGVRRGYQEGYLRCSMVRSAVERTNTGDNTPAIVYWDLVAGDTLEITLLVKGAGCDNMSALRMLTPAEGTAAMMDFVVETVERAGPNASPPLTVGVGLGGTFDRAAWLAKKALIRPSGQASADPSIAALEAELLDRINATGIGPAGYGGTVTALAVHIESLPTHIAAFPVAVNLDCHSHRVRGTTL